MATVPCNVNQTSIVSVVLDNCIFSDAETVLVLVGAIGKFENLLSSLASQRTLA